MLGLLIAAVIAFICALDAHYVRKKSDLEAIGWFFAVLAFVIVFLPLYYFKVVRSLTVKSG